WWSAPSRWRRSCGPPSWPSPPATSPSGRGAPAPSPPPPWTPDGPRGPDHRCGRGSTVEPLESWEVTHFRRLQAAWGAFVTARSLAAQVDPAVGRSWRRCAPLINPDVAPFFHRQSEHALSRRLTSLRWPIEAAKPVIEDMYQAIEGSRPLVLLTGASSCLMETVEHQATARRAASL